jgi:hypothetical protein
VLLQRGKQKLALDFLERDAFVWQLDANISKTTFRPADTLRKTRA